MWLQPKSKALQGLGRGDLRGLPSLPDPCVTRGTCQSRRGLRCPLPALANRAAFLRGGGTRRDLAEESELGGAWKSGVLHLLLLFGTSYPSPVLGSPSPRC